jgi:hypothetical protein
MAEEDYDEEEVPQGRFAKLKTKITPSRMNASRFAYSTFIVFGFVLALLFRDGFFGLFSQPCN